MKLSQQLLGGAAVAGERTLQWLTHAVERRLDSDRFRVSGQTPYEVIYSKDLLSVRRYAPLAVREIRVGAATLKVKRKARRVPIVLVPPLAATSLNFDLLPNRSLVKFLLASGFAVYLVDWGDPQADHSHLGLKDYTTVMLPRALKQVRADAGVRDVTLFGYCMGGLFALIYAGWSHDRHVRNIVTIASPIDAHQIGVAGKLLGMMQGPLRLAARVLPADLGGIDPKYLRVPGWVSALAFKLTNPLGTMQSYLDLLMNLWDREFVTEYETTSAWFNDMADYPGGIVQDFVLRVGVGNQLARGAVRLGRGKGARKALLDRIDCSLLAIAGANDKIVTVAAARKVLDIVASHDKQFVVAPGGHAGVFGGSKAPQAWQAAADFLSTRSS